MKSEIVSKLNKGVEFLCKKNNIEIDKSDRLFKADKEDCFDMFLRNKPSSVFTSLPPQLDYCMGRCDTRIPTRSIRPLGGHG